MKRLLLFGLCLLPAVASAQSVNCVSASPTVDTGGAYADGELIGGELTFSNLFRSAVGSAHVTGVTIADKAGQAVDLRLVLSRASLSGTTFTDQAAFDPADADLSKILAVLSFDSSARFAFSDNGIKHLSSLAVPVQSPTTATHSRHLYGALIAGGAYTGASASDLTVTVCAIQD